MAQLDDFFVFDAKVGHSFEVCERVGESGIVAEESKGVEEGEAVVDGVGASLRVYGGESCGESGGGEIARETGLRIVLMVGFVVFGPGFVVLRLIFVFVF